MVGCDWLIREPPSQLRCYVDLDKQAKLYINHRFYLFYAGTSLGRITMRPPLPPPPPPPPLPSTALPLAQEVEEEEVEDEDGSGMIIRLLLARFPLPLPLPSPPHYVKT